MSVRIATRRDEDLLTFMELNGFSVEKINNNLMRVTRAGELPVFVNVTDNVIYFEVDLGNVTKVAKEELYFRLLDANTEVLPVSFGINNTNSDDPRLVLVESRETDDLSDQELLAVFDALELAVDRAESILKEYM